MISLIVLLVIIAAIVTGTSAMVKSKPGVNVWLVILGIIMLVPGLCGTFFLSVSFPDMSSSREARVYMVLFTTIAVPSIQLSCLLLWLIARQSDVTWFRKLTRGVGWFAAAAALILLAQYVQMAIKEPGTLRDKAAIVGTGLLIAGLSFLVGGFLALRLKAKPDATP